MTSSLPRPFRGIIPPLATPLLDEERLDHAGLERLIEHVLAGGVHGLFLLGSTGEGPSLSYALRRELIERTKELVQGRVPLLVGITDTSFSEAVNMAEWAAECGVEAVVVAPPCYFVACPEELTGYIERLTRAIELPLYLYNMPALTKVAFELETVERLMQLEAVVGLKDSSADMIYFHRVVRLTRTRADFTLLMGPEELLADGMLLGAHGGICGGANLAPRLYVELYEAACQGNLEQVRVLLDRVLHLSGLLYSIGPGNSSYLRGLKGALSVLGLCEDYLAEPFRPFGPEEKALLHDRLVQLGLKAGKRKGSFQASGEG